MKKSLLFIICLSVNAVLFAQSASFELAFNGADTSLTGPSLSNQTAYFSRNDDNPAGNTFSDTSLNYSVTFGFSNQQFTTGTNANSYSAGLLFGAMSPGTGGDGEPMGYRLYQNMGAISAPANSMFTSVSSSPGGIEVEDPDFGNRNFAVELFADVKYLGTNSNAGKYYFGDFTLSFSRPVTNPVLQLAGLGSQFSFSGGIIGFSTEFELVTSGVTLSLLDGNTNLSVSGVNIENSASVKNATTGAASGSVLVTGSSITSLTFKVYVEGDGNTTHINWETGTNARPGDGLLIGVSLPTFTTLPVTLERFTTIANNCNVKIDFTTGVEDNVEYIRLQHSSAENGAFEDIYQWQPRGDNSRYEYIHPANSRKNFYRLAVTDKDSSKTYSRVSVATLAPGCLASVVVYPNPAGDFIYIQGTFNDRYSASLIDTKGRLVKKTALENGLSLHKMNIMDIAGGQYYLVIKNKDEIVVSQPVIKQ